MLTRAIPPFGLAILLLFAGSARPQVPGPLFAASMRGLRPYYVLGEPITVILEYGTVPHGVPFDLGTNGIPTPLQLALVGPGGAPIRATNRTPQGDWVPVVPGSDLYAMPPGETVELRYDLAALFPLQGPGSYRATLSGPLQAAIDELRFDLLALKPASSVSVARDVADPGNIRAISMRARVMQLGCKVVAGSVVREGKELWYAALQEIKQGEVMASGLPWQPPPPPATPYEAPVPVLEVLPGTKVAKADIDFRWQVWAALEAAGKHSLAVWNLRTGTVKMVIPWGDEPIELGSGAATNFTHRAKVVIAGPAGKTKVSTLSLGCEE